MTLEKTDKKIKRLAFFGDAAAKKTDQHYIDAFNVAKFLASKGYIICNGGGPGVMLASTLGAKESGGIVEAVILDPAKEPDNYEGANKENLALVDKIYTTEVIDKRTDKLIEVADAFIIFKGGTGTLAEIGTTWELARFDYKHHEPLIFFGEFWEKIVEGIIQGMEFTIDEQRVVTVVKTAEEVWSALKRVSK
jgi:uncharacterized protein (TIGR00725 family)